MPLHDGKQMRNNPSINPPALIWKDLSHSLTPQPLRHGGGVGGPRGDSRGDKRSRSSRRTIGEPPPHCSAAAECNSSAAEGRCGHIYSVCHRETYFSPTRPTRAVTAHQRLWLGFFSQQRNEIPSQRATAAAARAFVKVQAHY